MLTDRSRKVRSLCSTLAIATALVIGASTAQAQCVTSGGSFQGCGVFQSGSGTIGTTINTTTVTINTTDAVIDWTTFDSALGGGSINFQPSGTTATFQSLSDFSVLNRIFPTDPSRAIQFNGNVIAQIQSSTSVPGGTVFFYSPGGVIVGSTAVFNVGNLGLTSIAPAVVGGVFEQPGPNGEFVQFNGAVRPGSAVAIQSGAQITSSATNGSYVALVAPVIDQRGTINVRGGAALVSADAATLTFRPSGLFDIQVTSGTSGTGTTLFNNGTITGPASSVTGMQHRIFAVAVPKNTAITLAIAAGSQLGFDIAGAANVSGNAVVLSGGKDIINGNIQVPNSPGGGTGTADVQVFNTALTSSLSANASGLTSLFSTGGGTTTAASAVTLRGDIEAEIASIGAGSSTTVNGNASVLSEQFGGTGRGGTAEIFANTGGSVVVNGFSSLSARAFGNNGTVGTPTGGNATGGTAIVQALTGGTVTLNGTATLNAIGQGGAGFTGGGDGGVGTGGRAQLFVRDTGSSLTVNGAVTTFGGAFGGAGAGGGNGGAGIGGISLINAQAAASNGLTINGAATITARGQGGNGLIGGVGTGGTATAAASVGNTVNFNSTLAVDAQGTGGNGTQAGGIGNGGAARLTLFQNGTINVATNATVNANAVSGTGGVGTGSSVGGLASAVAQQNSVLDINGSLVVNAHAFGLGVTGRGSSGGSAVVGATGNSRVDVAGALRVRADGTAGDNVGTAGAGGNGVGGNAQVFANTGGDVLANELNLTAIGVGGFDVGTGAGSGTGGTASLFAGDAGSTIVIANGNTTGVMATGDREFMSASGFGGVSNGGGNGLGGAATGGTTSITSNNGAVLTGPATNGTSGLIRILARATGGNANTGAIAGGNATSGTINIVVDNASFSTLATILPSAFSQAGSASATATGVVNGGNAIGGNRNITINNGGTFNTSSPGGTAGGQGGNATASGRGGDASGGNATLLVDNNSTFNLAGNFAIFTTSSPGSGLNGGNATGGTAFARIANGSTINQTGPTTNGFSVSADAVMNTPGTVPGTGNGGTITAGTATLLVENATINAQTVSVSARAGSGAPQFYAQGTNATGGSATLQLTGAVLTADSVDVSAIGFGGSLGIGQSGVAGNGTGGLARLIATGGANSVTVTQSIGIGADGLGGDINGAAGTTTGNGIGGRAALVVSNGASLTLNTPDVFLSADGEGGEALGQSDFGGDGTGGQADVFANGGNLTVNGNLSLEGDNDGGEGAIGGDGLRRTDGIPNALLRAQNGTITVTGLTSLKSFGDGSGGSLGGRGGNAEGGLVVIDAQNNLAGASAINLQGVILDSAAIGGVGGGGLSSGTGGAGGNAFGGSAQLFGNAGNGVVNIAGQTILNASGFGGDGGMGGGGVNGGAGGAGGNGSGGFALFGTRSGIDTGTVNTGGASFGSVQALSNATGGTGGAGHVGSTTTGVGGAGGDAFGGGASVQVRGSTVMLNGAVILSSDATGGTGGTGSTQGVGGDAQGRGGDSTFGNLAGVGVLVTSRFEQPSQLGTLNGGTIFGNAILTPGAGSTPGTATIGDSPISVVFDGGSGTLSTIDLLATGTTLTSLFPSLLTLNNATLNVSNALSLETPGAMTVSLGSSTLNVGNLTLSAGNFVLPAVRPTTLGTINVSGGLTISSLLDFFAYANFNVAGSGVFDADGSVLTGDLTFGGPLDINALGSITTGNVQVVGDLHLRAGGAIQSGALTASQSVDLSSNGTVTTGALVAGDSVGVEAIGAVNIASASAGIVNPSSISGAEYVVALRSLASITAGNLSARGSVGVASPGSIAVGNVTTGSSGLAFLALAGTGLTTGSIDTTASTNGGQVYLANFSMEALGGQITSNFDPAPILAATPVAVGGPITINGAVNTRLFRAASTQGYTSGAITTSDTVSIDVTGPITLTGAVTSGRSVFLVSRSGSVSGQAITAGNAIGLSGLGSITVGNLSAGVVNRSTATGANYQVQLGSGASVATGSILTTGQALLRSLGTLTSGAITARDILVLASTGIATGALSTGSIDPVTLAVTRSGRILLADRSMAGVPASFAAFDPEPIFAATPIAMSGPISTGAVSTDTLRASATGTVAVGNVTSLNTLLNGVAGVSTGTVTAGQSASFFSSGGGVSAGAIQAGDSISVNAMGAVTLGNLSAGLVQPSTAQTALLRVALGSSAGSVTTGTIGARRDVGIQAAQAIATGNIAGRDVLLLPGTSLTTGSIQALNGTQPTGRVYVGNFSMVSPTNGNVFAVFANLPLFNLEPVRTGGPITIGGTVQAGSFKASTAQGFSAGTITIPSGSTSLFGELFVDSGQTIVVNGPWRAQFIQLSSNDIDITTTGTLTGFVELISTNRTIAVIGDISSSGATQPGTGGYRLTDAEFDRISGGFSFGARDNTGDVDLLIGDLSVDATRFSQDSEGGQIFVYSGDSRGEDDLVGRIRVDGNVTVTGVSSSTSGEEAFFVGFFSKAFELNAATGSITIAGANGVLAGAIEIEADNIHVASDAILLKLRADPFYEGSVQELNAAAAVQRPDGVLRANVIELEGNRTIYIQNTGSAVVPAGFVTRLDSLGEGTSIGPEDSDSTSTSEKFKIVINGQVQTDTGLVTGKAAFDLIIAAARSDLDTGEEFAANLDPASTLNGCNIISSVCAFGNSDPVSSISSEVRLAIVNQLADAPVPDVIEEAADSATESADEEAVQSAEEEDEAEADEASSPIAPPAPLINTRSLNPAVNVIEPVAGSGNPALIGSAVNEATAQGDTP